MSEICNCCEYEYEESYANAEKIINKGDEKFIDIYTKEDLVVKNKESYTHGDGNYQEYKEAGLIACPKCYTVKLIIIE